MEESLNVDRSAIYVGNNPQNDETVGAQGPGEEELPLKDSIGGLAVLFFELRGKLAYFMEENSVLKQSVEQAAIKIAQVNKEREILGVKIQQIERETVCCKDLGNEAEKLRGEREAFMVRVNELGVTLAASEARVQDLMKLSEKYDAERSAEAEKAAGVDAQLSRAIKVVEHLRKAVANRHRREDELLDQINRLQEQLKDVTSQRDVLLIELNEARNALEDVRLSILALRRESRHVGFNV